MLTIQAIWLEEAFSTASAVMREDCWTAMGKVAAMLPRFDNPAVSGFDLDLISNDYEQLERLFFGDASGAFDRVFLSQESAIANFNLAEFKGCALYELHRFEPKKQMIKASELRLAKSQKKPSARKMSRSKAAA
ncbi:MAG: hypothetical protein AAF329_01050 [Cyanobacteria bacterium P01_A01_bin.17]